MNNRWVKNIFVYAIIISVAMLSFFIFFDQSLSSTEEIGINEIPELARNRVSASKIFIEVEGENLKVIDGNKIYKSRKETGSSIAEIMYESGVDPSNYSGKVKGRSGLSSFFSVIIGFLPLILFGGLLIFMMRQAQGEEAKLLALVKVKQECLKVIKLQ